MTTLILVGVIGYMLGALTVIVLEAVAIYREARKAARALDHATYKNVKS